MVDIGDGEYVVRQSHNYRLCCQYHRGRTRTAQCDDRLPRTLPHRLSSHSGNFALRLGVADIGTLSWRFTPLLTQEGGISEPAGNCRLVNFPFSNSTASPRDLSSE